MGNETERPSVESDTMPWTRAGLAVEFADRHPATTALIKHFAYAHLPAGLQVVSAQCCALAVQMVGILPDGAELSAGLRKLLEAKDCFVRAALD
jgi:hypothetical protein